MPTFSGISPSYAEGETYQCTHFEIKPIFWIIEDVQRHDDYFQDEFRRIVNGYAIKIPDELGGIRNPGLCQILADAMMRYLAINNSNLFIAGELNSKFKLTRRRLKEFIDFLRSCGGYTFDPEGEVSI